MNSNKRFSSTSVHCRVLHWTDNYATNCSKPTYLFVHQTVEDEDKDALKAVKNCE